MNKRSKVGEEKNISAEALMCMGMWGIMGLLIIIGGIKGNQVTGFLSIFFAGNAVKAIYDFFKNKTSKHLWLSIGWIGLVIICMILYFLDWTW